jgi:fructose-bisphosphate aldolase, class I
MCSLTTPARPFWEGFGPSISFFSLLRRFLNVVARRMFNPVATIGWVITDGGFMSISTQEMAKTVAALTAPGKGILAADESAGTIEKRLKAVNVASTEEARRDYRELLFSTPGLGGFISGVILFEETLKQKSAAGVPLPELLKAQGIVPGIKVDKGTVLLSEFPGETVTQGLDGLAQRLSEYKQMGARFAKWRAVIHIGTGIPTPQAIASNAHALARYAAICQEQALVPIVEPEVLMDGDHTLATSARVTEEVLQAVFHALHLQRVALESMILKPLCFAGCHAGLRDLWKCHAGAGAESYYCQ